MTFGPEKEVEIFKALATKSAYKVGLEFGFDKVYSSPKAIRNAIANIYYKIQNNTDKYGVSDEVVAMVKKGMMDRKTALVGYQPSMAELKENTGTIEQVVERTRNKSWALIDKKLDYVASSRKALKSISFKELGVIAGIAFDKTQILKGEATEHIAVLAKIDQDITPAEALKLALSQREQNVGKNVAG